MKCARCDKERATKTDRVPPGWHRLREEIICSDCWKRSYMLRAITVPVAGPVDATWPELRAALSESWAATTQMANWAIRELFKADRNRTPEDQKLWPMPKVYLYPGARALRPDLSTATVVSILRAVEGRYRKRRIETLWRCEASLPNFRYPVPIPIHVDRWSVEREDGGSLVVSCPIGSRRFSLRLRGGARHRRARVAIERLLSGAAEKSEMTIYRVRANESSPDGRIVDRTAGGGRKERFELMAKLCLWLPRRERSEKDGAMILRTDSEHFFVATVPDRDPWILNADHVRRWVVEHSRRRQRMAEDLKYEKRWPARTRARMVERLDLWCEKQHRRLKSFIDMTVAMVAAFAARQRVATVTYDDTNHAYIESFPWFQIKERLKIKLDEIGVTFEASAEVAESNVQALVES